VTNTDGTTFSLTVTATAGDVDVPCGFVYRPISTGHKNMTIRTEEDGYKKEIYASSGNFKFSAEANNLGSFEFDFSGVLSKGYIATLATSAVALSAGAVVQNAGGTVKAVLLRDVVISASPQEIHYVYTSPLKMFLPNDQSVGFEHFTATQALKDITGAAVGTIGAEIAGGFGDMPMTPGVTFHTTTPPILQDAHLYLQSNGQTFKPVFNSVGLDSGNEIVVRKDGNSFNGLQTARITARKPTASADPEMMSASSFDIFNDWFNGLPASFAFRLGKGADGNSMYGWSPKAQFTGNSDGDRDGVCVVSSEFMLCGEYDGNDDEYTLVFY
jgi:hypothetical protein